LFLRIIRAAIFGLARSHILWQAWGMAVSIPSSRWTRWDFSAWLRITEQSQLLVPSLQTPAPSSHYSTLFWFKKKSLKLLLPLEHFWKCLFRQRLKVSMRIWFGQGFQWSAAFPYSINHWNFLCQFKVGSSQIFFIL
jgi:hypothetical protein